MVANMRGGGVRQGGSTITQQLAKTSFLSSDRTHQAQGAGGDHRLLARGLADQGRDPLALPVERLFRRRRLRAARRRASLFRPRSGESDARASRRCWRAWCRRRRGWRRRSTSRRAQKRSRLVLGGDGRHRRHQRGAGARDQLRRGRSRRRSKVPTGTYFADWVAPSAAEGVRGRLRRGEGPDDARRRPAAARGARGRATRRIGDAQAALVAMRPDGRVVAMVGGSSYRTSPVQPRHPGAPPAGIGVQAVRLSRRAARRLDARQHRSRTGRSPSTAGRPVNSDGVYRGRITLREAFARSSNAATVRLSERVGRAQCHPRRARPWHHHAACRTSRAWRSARRASACSS